MVSVAAMIGWFSVRSQGMCSVKAYIIIQNPGYTNVATVAVKSNLGQFVFTSFFGLIIMDNFYDFVAAGKW